MSSIILGIDTSKATSDVALLKRWNEIFADELLTHAIIDRVVHHAHILNITGKSYRINNYKSGGVCQIFCVSMISPFAQFCKLVVEVNI
ncbi:MAG: ATP-binding protein [Candidatus Tisiphia sp.]